MRPSESVNAGRWRWRTSSWRSSCRMHVTPIRNETGTSGMRPGLRGRNARSACVAADGPKIIAQAGCESWPRRVSWENSQDTSEAASPLSEAYRMRFGPGSLRVVCFSGRDRTAFLRRVHVEASAVAVQHLPPLDGTILKRSSPHQKKGRFISVGTNLSLGVCKQPCSRRGVRVDTCQRRRQASKHVLRY
eukprot:3934166-Pleurochrysis_carterae.AAC.1